MARHSAFHGGKTARQHSFAQVPSVGQPRSVFNRSHGHTTTFDAGGLYPIFIEEALPGDTLNLRMQALIRLSTPLWPIMDNLFADFFFFSVPNRLVWDNWQKFCGEQTDPGDSIAYSIPHVATGIPGWDTPFDYFGLPCEKSLHDINALPFRCYNLIWNEWFRDENLQDSVIVDTGDGTDPLSEHNTIHKRGKRHDYFTSALPWTQKGTAVELPLGASAPVDPASSGAYPTFQFNLGGNDYNLETSGTSDNVDFSAALGTANQVAQWDTTGLVADLSSATAASINQIREAFQVQRLLERDARGGTRYTEILRSHFNVVSPDQRLQRPEFLGGGSTRVDIQAVAAASGAAGAPDVGTLAAFGLAVSDGVGFVKSFVEHAYVIGLVNVRADITYQQGVHRLWSRNTRYDFFWPSLQHLGEQAILNKEIYYQNTGDDELVFGYQERYAEYRYKPSYVTNRMRSAHAQTLDAWHLALNFTALPLLNSVFIEDNPPVDRVVQVETEPHFKADFWFDYKCARPMATYSVPGMIDHF